MKAVFEKFPNAAISADTVIYNRDKGKILIGLRKYNPECGEWALPGGHFNPYDFGEVEMDWSIAHAAVREIKEETGLAFGAEELLFLNYYDHPDRVDTKRAITFGFYIFVRDEEIDGMLKAGDDFLDLKWMDIHNTSLPLAFDHNIIVDDFKRLKLRL